MLSVLQLDYFTGLLKYKACTILAVGCLSTELLLGASLATSEDVNYASIIFGELDKSITL